MEKLLQAAQAHLEKVSSKAQQAEKAKAGAKHQTSVHMAARVLPKDYPVRPQLITLTIILTQSLLFLTPLPLSWRLSWPTSAGSV